MNAGSYAVGLTNVSAGATLGGLGYAAQAGPGSSYVIIPAVLTYAATAANQTYGSANTSFSGDVTGFVNSETLTSATTGTAAFASATTATSNVGSYAIAGSGLTADNGNYTFAQAGPNATALTIDPKVLTLAGQRTYDGTTTIAGGILSATDLVPGDSVTIGGTTTTSSPDTSTYTDLPTGSLTSSDLNYTLTGASVSATIDPKALSGSALIAGIDKIYDGGAGAGAGSLVIVGATDGVIAGDSVTLSSTGGAYASANASASAQAVSGLTGLALSSSNYTLGALSVTGSGTISPKALSGVLAISDGITRSYNGAVTGAAVTAEAATDNGVVGGDIVPVPVSITFDSPNVGPRQLIAEAMGVSNANYTLGTLAFDLTNTGSAITPAPLSVAGLTATNKVYDGTTNDVLNGAATLIGSTFDPLTLSGTAAGMFADKNAGANKIVSVSGLSVNNSNYSLTLPTLYANIVSAPLTVTAAPKGKFETQPDPALTYALTSGQLTPGDTDATVFTGALERVPGETVGQYPILEGTLAANTNYALTFVGNILAIQPIPGALQSLSAFIPATTATDSESPEYAHPLEGLIGFTGGRTFYDPTEIAEEFQLTGQVPIFCSGGPPLWCDRSP